MDRFTNLAQKHLLEKENQEPQVKGFFVKKKNVEGVFGPFRADEISAINPDDSLIPTMMPRRSKPINYGVFI